MLRLHILSDLHLEFADDVAAPPAADAVVLAGDIGVGVAGLEWAARRFVGLPVVYVPGNHEYYGTHLERGLAELQSAGAALGIAVLSDSSVEIAGVRFLGCTLWSDFAAHGRQQRVVELAAMLFNDYERISTGAPARRLLPVDTVAMHERSRSWLADELRAAAGRPTVVVTHHAPSTRSLLPWARLDPSTAAHASNLDALVADSGALLWVHGHTHRSTDYRIGATRVVSNQRGYPGDRFTGFAEDLVIEI